MNSLNENMRGAQPYMTVPRSQVETFLSTLQQCSDVSSVAIQKVEEGVEELRKVQKEVEQSKKIQDEGVEELRKVQAEVQEQVEQSKKIQDDI